MQFSKSQNPNELEITAFHEAGHALAAIAMRRPFSQITIGLKGDDMGGLTQDASEWCRESPDDAELQYRVTAQIIVAYAGPAAEARHTGSDPGPGAQSDYATAEYFATVVGDQASVPEYLAERRADAHALINSNWEKVERLARALMARKSLTFKEALRAIG